MNLKEKLARLERSQPIQKPLNKKNIFNPDHLLPGKIYETENGACRRIQKKYNFYTQHGSFLLGDFCKNNFSHIKLVVKNGTMDSICPDQLLFVDTETTGLSGGIGTVAFLIGVGYFNENSFIIDQYFMRDFHEESVILNVFLQLLKQRQSSNGAIVSFNGKSYDLPLLLNRSIFHKFIRTNPEFHHIDLLHPARRFWKDSFPDCALGTLESNLLNVQRNGDVPGYMIPEIYFNYLRSKDPGPLLPVFYHNQMDVLSLVGILHLMLQFYTDNKIIQNVPIDWLAVGTAYDEIGDYKTGLEFYLNVLNKTISPRERKETLLRIAGIYKKLQKYEEAVPFWEKALELPGFSVEPYEELAKIYEHRLLDLPRAKQFTQKALENIRLLNQLNKGEYRSEIRQKLLWRLHRLERKLSIG